MTEQAKHAPFDVIEKGHKFVVRNDVGRTVMVCTDQPSALHYAQLMNAAFDAGYKKGRRERS
ncbi:MAG: hypothetical protein OEM60_05080 [Gammaproteobacteria bacterium]|nr:hypothetical protein [Gammaproteobacteria bacterium]MDH3432178.1 hypothetical protein [Gammaproteobacteria bacterium]MDH3433206.1 hypothetical protein [Gammaproteobacteria bacterium]